MRARILGLALVVSILVAPFHTPCLVAGDSPVQPVTATLWVDRCFYRSNGELFWMDASPRLIDGRCFVPVRYCARALGIPDEGVAWNEATGTVTISLGQTSLALTVGSRLAVTNGVTTEMDVAPKNIDGRVYLPARLVAEGFGYQVAWSRANGAVTLAAPDTSESAMPDPEWALATPQRIRVLVLNFDPILESAGSQRLHEFARGNDPRQLATQYCKDIREASGGLVDYVIVEWKDIDAFPPLVGWTSDEEEWVRNYEAYGQGPMRIGPNDVEFDYDGVISQYGVVPLVESGQIDELWVFTLSEYGVLWESTMAGERAYWCNSMPRTAVKCKRAFAIMGFSYERGVDYMLESFGHRAESILTRVYERWSDSVPYDQMNTWERFTLYDKIAPERAACGNIHYAPNSLIDYDLGNARFVVTSYPDWRNYPDLTGLTVAANCQDWGNGDVREHHLWWLGLFPHVDGRDADGVLNNWWFYLVNPAATDPLDAMREMIRAGDRDGLSRWLEARSIASINCAVKALDPDDRAQLAEVLLKSNAEGETREKILRAMRVVLSHPDLGFYAEIWSYTDIMLQGDGFVYFDGKVLLSPEAFARVGDCRDLLMHESFHSFNARNGGPVGALDEGSAIWIFKMAFPEGRLPSEDWAEATYGTALFYRDIMNAQISVQSPASPTQKLKDVYQWLSASDPSHLPWDDEALLVKMFRRYYEPLDRDVDFFEVWLPSVRAARDRMLADPDMARRAGG